MEPKSPEVQAKSSVGKKKSPGKADTKVGKLPAIVADSNSDREIIPAGVMPAFVIFFYLFLLSPFFRKKDPLKNLIQTPSGRTNTSRGITRRSLIPARSN